MARAIQSVTLPPLFLLCAALLGGALTHREGHATGATRKFRAGTIKAEAISENSGLAASRRHAGVYWTVNDSGNAPVLYAITGDGQLIAEFPVAAKNTDWEDLAIDDDGRLYIADVGNNGGRRKQVQVLRVDEPDPRAPRPAKAAPLGVTATWQLTYPHRPFDCESLFVLDGHGYVVSKRADGGQAEVFRFALKPPAKPIVLERVAAIPAVRAPVTAADISSDGKRLAVLTVLGPYVLEINGDVKSVERSPAVRYSRYVHPRMEAACFVPGGLMVTAETREVFFFADKYFKPVGGAESSSGVHIPAANSVGFTRSQHAGPPAF